MESEGWRVTVPGWEMEMRCVGGKERGGRGGGWRVMCGEVRFTRLSCEPFVVEDVAATG